MKPQKLKEALKGKLTKKELELLVGSYDVVAEFETDTQSEMNQVITNKIRQLKKIRSTITLRAMN